MILQSHYYTLVTLDDIVTVIVIGYKDTEKDIKGFEKIMLYSI